VVETLRPVQERYRTLMADRGELERLMAQGARRAQERAQRTLAVVYEQSGLLRGKG